MKTRCASGFALIGFAAALFLPAAAAAAMTGRACVTDANHLVIDGRRSYGKCVGGTRVVLADIEVPPLTQTCGDAHGCGVWAAYFLTELIKGKDITCEGNATDPDGNVVAICSVGDREINRAMVELGWALPVSDQSPYIGAMQEAKEKQRGLWNPVRFAPPSRWRKQGGK